MPEEEEGKGKKRGTRSEVMPMVVKAADFDVELIFLSGEGRGPREARRRFGSVKVKEENGCEGVVVEREKGRS